MSKLIPWFLLFLSVSADESLTPDAYDTKRVIQLSWEVKNTTNENLSSISFSFLLPVKQTSTQYLQKTELSHKGKIRVDKLGNQVCTVSLDLAPYETVIIKQKAFLLMALEAQNCKLSIPESIKSGTNTSYARLASSLSKENTIESAANIFSWITSNIKQDKTRAHSRDSSSVLSEKKATNREKVELYRECLNSLNISNYKSSGFIVSQNSVLNPAAMTLWNTVKSEKSWINTYFPKKKFNKNNDHFITFKIHGNQADKWMDNELAYHLKYTDLTKLKVLMN